MRGFVLAVHLWGRLKKGAGMETARSMTACSTWHHPEYRESNKNSGEEGEMLHGFLQYSPGGKIAARALSGGFRSGERLVNGSPAHGPLFSCERLTDSGPFRTRPLPPPLPYPRESIRQLPPSPPDQTNDLELS